MFFLVIRNSSNKRRIGGAALIQGRRLIEGGAYSSKYGIAVCLDKPKYFNSRLKKHAKKFAVHGSFKYY